MSYSQDWNNRYNNLRMDGSCAHLGGVRTAQGAAAGLRQRLEQRTRLCARPAWIYLTDVEPLVTGSSNSPLRNWSTRRGYLFATLDQV